METKGQVRQIGEFFRRAFRLARKGLSLLAFSAADERLLPRKIVSISIEKGAVGAAAGRGFLSRIKIIKEGRSETGGQEYPGPAELARAAKSVLGVFNSGGAGPHGGVLVIPAEWVVQKDADFPAAIRHDIPNAVSYELDRLVPFEAGRMFYDWRVAGEDGRKLTLRVSAVKLEKVKPFIDVLAENGIAVSRIVYADENFAADKNPGGGQSSSGARLGISEALRFNPAGPDLFSNGRRRKAKVPVAGSALLVFLLLALWGYRVISPIRVEAGNVEALDRQIALEKKKVFGIDGIMKQIGVINGEISAMRDFDLDRSAAIRTVKELTAVIPQSAWLTGLEFSGDSVRIEGYAASASGLIPRLERSGYFRKAEFASPTLRDAKTKSDHFIIKVQRAGASGQGKPAGAKK